MKVICDHSHLCKLGTSEHLPVLIYTEFVKTAHAHGYTHCEGQVPMHGAQATMPSLPCKWQERVGDTAISRRYVEVPE